MMTPEQLKTKRVLVVGAGVTGVSVMQYLKRHTVSFDVTDSKSALSEPAAQLIDNGQYIFGLKSVDVSHYDVMVLSPGIPRAHPMLVAALEAGVHIIGDVELFAAVVPGDVIAITGSNGKSTVASMAAHVLHNAGRRVELCGNIGTAVLDVLPKEPAASKDDASVCVLELSSYQLESVYQLAPLSAVVLNISDDHLDRYESIEHYAATKRRVYDRATYCISNYDDARTRSSADDAEFSLAESKAKFQRRLN